MIKKMNGIDAREGNHDNIDIQVTLDKSRAHMQEKIIVLREIVILRNFNISDYYNKSHDNRLNKIFINI